MPKNIHINKRYPQCGSQEPVSISTTLNVPAISVGLSGEKKQYKEIKIIPRKLLLQLCEQ